MNKIYFNDMFDLANFMVENADDDKNVCAVFHYNEATQLLRELILLADDYAIHGLELEPVEWNDYDKEYYISLNKICGISVERVFKLDKCLGVHADIMLLSPDASSKIITCPTSEVDMMFEVSFDSDDVCDDCSNCKLCSLDFELAKMVKDIFGVLPSSVDISNDGHVFSINLTIDE